jgi:hypothetical protein
MAGEGVCLPPRGEKVVLRGTILDRTGGVGYF